MLIAFVYMLFEMIYTLYGTKNMKKVEKFLESKKSEPIYALILLQANGSMDEQLRTIEDILKKYPKNYIHHNYRFIREMLNKNYDTALNEAEKIEKEPFMSYCKALVYATQGNKEQALDFPLPKKWMSEAILATLAKVDNNQKSYETHKENAIEAARGIQRYGLIHTL